MKSKREAVDPIKAKAASARAKKIRMVAAKYKKLSPKQKYEYLLRVAAASIAENMTSANVGAPPDFNQAVDAMPKFGPIGSVTVVPDENGMFKIILDYGDGPMDLEGGIETSEEAESLAQVYRDEYGGGEEIPTPVAESKKGNQMNISKLLEAVTKGENPDALLDGLFEDDTDAAEISSGQDVGDSLNIDPNDPGDDDTGEEQTVLPDVLNFPYDGAIPSNELGSKDDVGEDDMEALAMSAFDGEGDEFMAESYMESLSPEGRLRFRQRVRENLRLLLGEDEDASMPETPAEPAKDAAEGESDEDKAKVSDTVKSDGDFEQGSVRAEDNPPAPTVITAEGKRKAFTNQAYYANERQVVNAGAGSRLSEEVPDSPYSGMSDFFEQYEAELLEDEAEKADAFKPEEPADEGDDLLHPGATSGPEVTDENDPENATGGILGGDPEYGAPTDVKVESISIDDRLRRLRYLNEEEEGDSTPPFVKKGEDKDSSETDDSSPSSDNKASSEVDNKDDGSDDDEAEDDDAVEFPEKDADDKKSDDSDDEESDDEESDDDNSGSDDDESDDDEESDDDSGDDDSKGNGKFKKFKKKDENVARELGREAVSGIIGGAAAYIGDKFASSVHSGLKKKFKKRRHESIVEDALDDFLKDKEDETVLKKVENKKPRLVRESEMDKQLLLGTTVYYNGSGSEVSPGTRGTIVDQESSNGGYMYMVAFVGRPSPLLCNQSDLTV